jgi:hypothetical protein
VAPPIEIVAISTVPIDAIEIASAGEILAVARAIGAKVPDTALVDRTIEVKISAVAKITIHKVAPLARATGPSCSAVDSTGLRHAARRRVAALGGAIEAFQCARGALPIERAALTAARSALATLLGRKAPLCALKALLCAALEVAAAVASPASFKAPGAAASLAAAAITTATPLRERKRIGQHQEDRHDYC